jgi:hypothetical protein
MCGAPLRLPRVDRLWGVPGAVCGFSLACLVSYLVGLRSNGLLAGTVVLGYPATMALGAVVGLIRGLFFPSLERDLGDDDGFLHIAPPPGPPKRP